METIIKHGSIPKTVCIPMSDITEFILNFSDIAGMGTLDEVGLAVLMKELFEIVISEQPDNPYPALEQTANFLISRNVTFKQFINFKQYIVASLETYLRQIDMLRTLWREHADPYLSYSVTEENKLLVISFNPIYPSRDFSGVLLREIEQARINNEFIPYKYLRVLGMC